MLADCQFTGDVFNPFDDMEGRGELPYFFSDAKGSVNLDDGPLMQNLTGENTLIGRSLELYETVSADPIMCGVIGTGHPQSREIVNDFDFEQSTGFESTEL